LPMFAAGLECRGRLPKHGHASPHVINGRCAPRAAPNGADWRDNAEPEIARIRRTATTSPPTGTGNSCRFRTARDQGVPASMARLVVGRPIQAQKTANALSGSEEVRHYRRSGSNSRRCGSPAADAASLWTARTNTRSITLRGPEPGTGARVSPGSAPLIQRSAGGNSRNRHHLWIMSDSRPVPAAAPSHDARGLITVTSAVGRADLPMCGCLILVTATTMGGPSGPLTSGDR
jgi:hypothetical protein